MLGVFVFLGHHSGMTRPPPAPLQLFLIATHRIHAQDCVQGFFVNPNMPQGFDDCPNEERPFDHMIWWMRPFIEGEPGRWSVRMLDGGAWDRSSWIGDCKELDEAVELCQELVLKPRLIYKAKPLTGSSMAEAYGMEKLKF